MDHLQRTRLQTMVMNKTGNNGGTSPGGQTVCANDEEMGHYDEGGAMGVAANGGWTLEGDYVDSADKKIDECSVEKRRHVGIKGLDPSL